MSFHRSAAGSRHTVIAQLRSRGFHHDGELAENAVGLVEGALNQWGDDRNSYSVQINGHGSGGHLSLAIDLKSHGELPAEILDGERLLKEMRDAAAADLLAETAGNDEPVEESEVVQVIERDLGEMPEPGVISFGEQQGDEPVPSTGQREQAGDSQSWAI